jgi:hypothetical protein
MTLGDALRAVLEFELGSLVSWAGELLPDCYRMPTPFGSTELFAQPECQGSWRPEGTRLGRPWHSGESWPRLGRGWHVWLDVTREKAFAER